MHALTYNNAHTLTYEMTGRSYILPEAVYHTAKLQHTLRMEGRSVTTAQAYKMT